MKLKYGPYSPSRLDTATCGYSFYKQYVDPERKSRPRIEGIAQARGSAVHEIFEVLTAKMRLNSGMPLILSDEEVRKLVSDAVIRHPAAYDEIADILKMAKLYAQLPPPVLTSDAGIEIKLAVKMEGNDWVECSYDDPEAVARGRADILMFSDDLTTALIYDHKTQPNVEEADTFQMGFYSWVIAKTNPGLERVQTVLHFARYGKYSEPYTWNADQHFQIEDELMTKIQMIESRTSWDPTPNKNCQYCPFISECPVMKQYLIQGEDGRFQVDPANFKILGNTNKAVEMAGLLTVLEEAVKIIKSELRTHVKGSEYGIAIPGRIYEYRTTEGIHWDKVNKGLREQVYAVFNKHGIDPKRFMGFSQTFTDSVWLFSNKELLDELAAILPRKKSSEFGGHKV